MPAGEEATAPRTRTPRAEGRAHMIDATIRLLQDRKPDELAGLLAERNGSR
jgi:hypothetical protein